MSHKRKAGTWRIRERGTDNTIAHVKMEFRGTPEGAYIYVKPEGKGEWIEDATALDYLMGDEGAVEEIDVHWV